MRKFILMSIFAVGLFHASVALADANLCNNSPNPIWASYGEYSASNTAWISGWFYTTPGQCSTPLVGDVCFWWAYVWGNCPFAVLFYANDAYGDQWGGWGESVNNNGWPQTICTTYNAFYENAQLQWQNSNCPANRVWLYWGGYVLGGPTDTLNINFD